MKKLILFCFLLIFNSCNQVIEHDCYDENQVVMKKNILFEINDYEFELDSKIYNASLQDENFEYSLLITSAKKALFEEIGLLVNSTIIDIDKIHLVTLYFDNNKLDLEESFSKDAIRAISFFEEQNGNLFHRLFVKNASDFFLELDALSCFAKTSHNSMVSILKDVLDCGENGSYMMIFRSEYGTRFDSLPKTRHNLPQRLTFFLRDKISSNSLKSNNDPPTRDRCLAPCGEDWEDHICLEDHPEFGGNICDFDKRLCSVAEMHEIYSLNQEVTNENLNLQHDFEGNFLLQHNFGKNYVGYYYKLAAEVNLSEIEAPFAAKLLQLFSEINPSLDYLLNSNENLYTSNYVPFTTAMKDHAVSVINDFKALTSDLELLGIFDNVEQDFNKYENKTFSYIMNDCCN